jgi:RHS repeat-associated protein
MKTKHIAGVSIGLIIIANHAGAGIVGYEKYTYDASGNIIEKSLDEKVTKMTFDQSNRLIEKQSQGQSKCSITYDAAGHPIAENTKNGQLLRSMSYGYGDKVLEANNQGQNASLYYNAEGQLIGKCNNGTVSSYSWDGNVLVADGTKSFTNEAHLSGGVPVIAGDQTVVVSDYLGNTLSQGISHLVSTAYGEGLEAGRFTGKIFSNELRTYVFQYRNYSPETSKWTTSDPTGFPDGTNPSSYTNGEPLSKIDPLGLAVRDPGGKLYNKTNCKKDGKPGWIIQGKANGNKYTVTPPGAFATPYDSEAYNHTDELVINALRSNLNYTVSAPTAVVKIIDVAVGQDSSSAVTDCASFETSSGGTPYDLCGAGNVITVPKSIAVSSPVTVFEK